MIKDWDEWFPFRQEKQTEVATFLDHVDWEDLKLPDLIKANYLAQKYQNKGPKEYDLSAFLFGLNFNEQMMVLSVLDLLDKDKEKIVLDYFEKNYSQNLDYFLSSKQPELLKKDELVELLHYDLFDDLDIEHVEGVKLFLLLNRNRKYPGLLIMKDLANRWVRNESGELWSLPALASSKHDLPFYSSNGQTPQGVLCIDSVMPEANNTRIFGKQRRLILNFTSRDVENYLPENHLKLHWWKQAEVARQIGRRFFRIHGTGLNCSDANASYAPFVRTSGCVSMREVESQYNDQRMLLDQMMKAHDLDVLFENEIRIKGLLYVVEISNDVGPINLSQIQDLID